MERDIALITQSVPLIGRGHNSTKPYPTERDLGRSRSQWRRGPAIEDQHMCWRPGGQPQTHPRREDGLHLRRRRGPGWPAARWFSAPLILFATSCPYLLGPPVHLLAVPIQVQPPRLRGASMSAVADGSSHTMNPQDKFLTPRAPPPLPSSLPRLNTSTALLSKKRSERSLSAKAEKSARSPWTFFGIRAPALSPSSPVDRRGRSASSGKPAPARRKSSAASLDDAADPRQVRSYPQTRDCSPSSGAPSRSRDPSPPRHPRPDSTYSPALLEIPDEIAEDAEDDANFAYQRRISLAEKAILTQLAPPPASRGPLAPHRPGAARDTQKPLPQIPQLARENIILSPLPRLHLAPSSDNLPASRFSFSTLASPVASPTDSQFSWSSAHSPPSVTSDIDADGDSGCGDAFTYSPVVAESPGRASSGYHAWPGGGYASEWAPSSPSPKAAKRVTFGAGNETPAYLRLDERFTPTDGRDGVPTGYDQRRVAPPSDTLLEPDLGHETSDTGAQAPHRGLTFLPSPG
ncbi:unnamed protein product [Diplocarpon coronariae]